MNPLSRDFRNLSVERSDLLHSLRWLSAVVVVIGHAQMYQHAISGRAPATDSVWGYLGAHAHYAVMVFFVLSGFVVAYATDQKVLSNAGYGLREYFADRWSRIYSVLLPAVLLTVIVDLVGFQLFAAYSDPTLIPQEHYWFRLFANVVGLQGSWGLRIQMGSNPALWSIAYELAFYALWGVYYFRSQLWHGSRVVLWLIVGVWLAVFGWKIAWYFLLWLLGVGAWRFTALNSSRSERYTFPVHLLLLGLLVANHIINYERFFCSSELINDSLFSLSVAAILCVNVKMPDWFGPKLRAFNRWMADFSYSIYAYHLPVVFFICAILATIHPSLEGYPIESVALVLVPIIVARSLYYATEAQRSLLRDALLKLSSGLLK